jgi:2-desacetyl-2-hydroxyethyl bacteriochlorophyllide A dehydrogenase
MKAVICAEPNVLKLEEVPVPVPSAGEVLVRIRRIGVCGTDLHAFEGSQPFFTYPRILGHELAGRIEAMPAGAIPQGSPTFRIGDPVAIVPYMECGGCIACRAGKPNCCVRLNVLGVHSDGGMCEYLAVPTDHLIRAEGLDWDQIALVECLSIGAHAVQRAQVQPGEFALVIGAGPIGLGAIQAARTAGARVTAMDSSDSRLDFCVSKLNLEAVVKPGEDARARIADITGGEFPSVVFDATGNAASMKAAVEYLAHGGRLVYIGLVKGEIALSDPEFHKRETTLLASRNATRQDFMRVMEAIRSGKSTTEGFVTHRTSFADLPKRFSDWTDPRSGVIKAMVEVA